jgi:hypothetical protein
LTPDALGAAEALADPGLLAPAAAELELLELELHAARADTAATAARPRTAGLRTAANGDPL